MTDDDDDENMYDLTIEPFEDDFSIIINVT